MTVTFTVRVTPRAGRDEVVGVAPGGDLLVKVRAAPADGAANIAVVRLLADALGVAPSRLQLVRGATSRIKVMAIDGIEASALTSRWPGLVTRSA
ncbi:MAG: DUF167 domain-containing protein [Chloroflexota bacterium]|nr:DUF167 domain-containing protein [Chloroflexota bacterium]